MDDDSTISDFFHWLLLSVICGGMMLMLVKVNAHLNTEDRMLMPPFGSGTLKTEISMPVQVMLSPKKPDTHKNLIFPKHNWRRCIYKISHFILYKRIFDFTTVISTVVLYIITL